MLQVLMLGFEFCWNLLDISTNISKKLVIFYLRVAPSGGGIWNLYFLFFIRNGVYTLLLVPNTLVLAWNGVPKIFHKKCVSVLLLLPRHTFWKSVGCSLWSTFFSHPNSQNNGEATLHMGLKFDTTLHPCNTPNKGGYTIEHSHGTPCFLSGALR